MEAKRWWRGISLTHLNILLYLTLAVIALAFGPQLGWALHALPVYLEGNIPLPIERSLYEDAEKLPAAEAIPMLERSIAIDPNTKARYLLARKLAEAGRLEEACAHYRSYLEMDAFERGAYLELAGVLEQQGKQDDAARVLERGAAHFREHVERYRPRVDPSVDQVFNDKAQEVYEDYRGAVDELEAALKRVRAG